VLSEEVAKITTELKAAEKARDTYKMSLSGDGYNSITDGMASPAVVELENRLEAQQKRLDDLLQRFTESHPEVINARRLVAQLIAELKNIEQDAASGKTSTNGARRTAINPVYQRLKLQLVETEAQVASLRSQLATKQSILEQARSVGDRMPQVEAELAQLNRDYDVIRKNYDALVSRREAASLGMKLSENSQLAEFRIVEPVKVSSSPVFPSRFHLSLIAVFVAILAGIGSTILADSLHPTVHSADALRRLSGRPVLGTISLQISPRHVQIQRAELRRLTVALATLMVIQAVWVVWVAAYQ
jgi:polysaccharide chain length determinant protein (PEP-CTERM system associated)